MEANPTSLVHIERHDVVRIFGLHVLRALVVGDVLLIAGDVALGHFTVDLAKGDTADCAR